MEKTNINTTMYSTLPLKIKYKDKIELIRKLLNVYSVIFKKMTNRNIDLLTLCMLEDVNSSDFRKIVINAGLGFNNEQHVNSELHRLRKEGFLYKDGYLRDNLEDNLQRIKNIVNGDGKIALYLAYDNEKG